jgi:hypothetical protein
MIAATLRSEAHAPTCPRRLQRSRRKGATTPEGARYVGRPTLFGNPFRIDRFGHARAVALHRRWLAFRLGALTLERLGFSPHEIAALDRLRGRVIERLPELVDRNLQCWCPLTSKWCHADTLLKLANRSTRPRVQHDGFPA